MASIEWNPDWTTGVELIDRQHHELVELLNRLLSMVDARAEEPEAKRALSLLADYVEFHFDAEEALMEQTAYPDLLSHRLLHQDMRNRVRGYLRHYWTQPHLIPEDVRQFLISWLSDHLSGVDQAMARHVRSQAADTSGS